MTRSPAETLALLPPADRAKRVAALGADQIEQLRRTWRFWARPEQLAPGGSEWRWWGVVTGRGWGKTRTGAEWVVDRCEAFAAANRLHLVGIVNSTLLAVRALQFGGESGIRAVCKRRGHRFHHSKSDEEATLEVRRDDGTWHTSTLELHAADIPERARGRNFHSVWCDEAAAWRHKVDDQGGTAFSNVDFGLRAICPPGMEPQGVVTTTPKPIPMIRDLLARKLGPTVITTGTMYDNLANLSAKFIEAVTGRYGATRLGRQEIEGILLDGVEGALWSEQILDLHRWRSPLPKFAEIVVGVDPPGSTAECGIVVCALAQVDWLNPLTGSISTRRAVWVLDDMSIVGEPEEWGTEVVKAARRYGASRIVAEVNYGGAMVRSTIHAVDPTITVTMVRATKGKRTRAEPIATATSQGRVHLFGQFGDLESQLVTWVPGDDSPDRLDAFVWAATELLGDESPPGRAVRASQAQGRTGTARGAAVRAGGSRRPGRAATVRGDARSVVAFPDRSSPPDRGVPDLDRLAA